MNNIYKISAVFICLLLTIFNNTIVMKGASEEDVPDIAGVWSGNWYAGSWTSGTSEYHLTQTGSSVTGYELETYSLCSANYSVSGSVDSDGTVIFNKNTTSSSWYCSWCSQVTWTGALSESNTKITGTYSGGACSGTFSLNFKITQPPSPPKLISPGFSTEPGQEIDTLTPTFQWNSAQTADYYALYVSRSPYGEDNMVFNSSKDYGQIYENTFLLPVEKLVNEEQYQWNMKAHNRFGWSDVSDSLYFTTSNGQHQPVDASFDKHLLDILDQYADSYYNSNWNLDINQYKAWILTIAWGEGGRGGYVAHSQGELGNDLFYHRAANVGNNFTFSTGLGPFQLDNGGYDHWELWCTIDKLDPEKAVKTILNQHYKKYGDGKTLWDFSNSSSWLSVNPNYFDRAKILWNQVTGTDWDTYKRGKTDLEWSGIKNGLIANSKNNPIYEYDENIKNVGKIKWNITSDDSIKTDSPQAKTVIFDNYYETWLITARSGSGYKLFDYYYTKNPEQKIELWVWNNSGDLANKLKYIYVRDNSTGQYPENRTADKLSAGHILNHAALDPSKKLIEQSPSSDGPTTPGFELIPVIFALALVLLLKRKRYN